MTQPSQKGQDEPDLGHNLNDILFLRQKGMVLSSFTYHVFRSSDVLGLTRHNLQPDYLLELLHLVEAWKMDIIKDSNLHHSCL